MLEWNSFTKWNSSVGGTYKDQDTNWLEIFSTINALNPHIFRVIKLFKPSAKCRVFQCAHASSPKWVFALFVTWALKRRVCWADCFLCDIEYKKTKIIVCKAHPFHPRWWWTWFGFYGVIFFFSSSRVTFAKGNISFGSVAVPRTRFSTMNIIFIL